MHTIWVDPNLPRTERASHRCRHILLRVPQLQRGAGLTELLIVLAVFAILAAVTVPAIETILESYYLETSAATIGTKVVDARMAAIKLNRETWVQIDPAAGTAQVKTTGAGGSVDIGTAVLLSRDVKFGAGAPTQIRMDATGLPMTSYNLTLETSRSRKQTKLEISLSGKVKTKKVK